MYTLCMDVNILKKALVKKEIFLSKSERIDEQSISFRKRIKL